MLRRLTVMRSVALGLIVVTAALSTACSGADSAKHTPPATSPGSPSAPAADGIPEEFLAACGHPGARVVMSVKAVTVPHAVCDLTGVTITYPGRGGAAVPKKSGGVGNSMGFTLEVAPKTKDVTIRVTGAAGNA